jgi:hypothetical protein
MDAWGIGHGGPMCPGVHAAVVQSNSDAGIDWLWYLDYNKCQIEEVWKRRSGGEG